MSHSFVFTDLDDTLFSSLRKQPDQDRSKMVVGALDKSQQPRCFLNEKQYDFFKKLQMMGEIVPVTARDSEQFKRVVFLENTNHAVWKHGALIRLNGKIDQDWRNRSLDILSYYQPYFTKLTTTFQKDDRFVDFDFVSRGQSDLDNMAYQLQIKRKNKKGDFLFFDEIMEIISDNIDLSCYHIHRQIDYISLLPKDINKRNAVIYLQDKLKPSFSVGCGDSDVDVEFMKECDYLIFPKTSMAFNELYEQQNKF